MRNPRFLIILKQAIAHVSKWWTMKYDWYMELCILKQEKLQVFDTFQVQNNKQLI